MPPAWPGLPRTASHHLLPHSPDTLRRTWSGGNRFCPAARQEIVPLPGKIRSAPDAHLEHRIPGAAFPAFSCRWYRASILHQRLRPAQLFPFAAFAHRHRETASGPVSGKTRSLVWMSFSSPLLSNFIPPCHYANGDRSAPNGVGAIPILVVIRCCPAWTRPIQSRADTSRNSSKADLLRTCRPSRFPRDAGRYHK